MMNPIRRLARSRFPGVLNAFHTYRLARDLHSRRFRDTGLGFRFRGHQAMEAGTFEPDETGLITGFTRPGRVFVDVGANLGYFVCIAHTRGAHVVAVEPMAQNVEALMANLEENGFRDGIEIFPVGLGSAPGVATLYGGGTAASIMKNWSGTSEVWKRRIAVSTLDIVLGDRFAGQEMLVKIDVEGFELHVLRGATRTLARTPAPVWLVEVLVTEHHPEGFNPEFADVFALFRDAGYEARTLDEGGRLVTEADVQRWVTNRKRDFGGINYVFRKVQS